VYFPAISQISELLWIKERIFKGLTQKYLKNVEISQQVQNISF